jgi:DNA-binding NarL/FixJ family response regulator
MLVNDRPAVRKGLQAVLEANPDIVVAAAVETVPAAVSAAAREHPDVVVVDDYLAKHSGVQACRAIRDAYPPAHALLLVSSGGDEALTATALAGASGYVVRDLDTAHLQSAVLTAGHETPMMDRAGVPELLDRLLRLATEGRRDHDVWCSSRLAHTLLELVGEGLPDHEISERLDIPIETVRDAVRSLVEALPSLRRLAPSGRA